MVMKVTNIYKHKIVDTRAVLVLNLAMNEQHQMNSH